MHVVAESDENLVLLELVVLVLDVFVRDGVLLRFAAPALDVVDGWVLQVFLGSAFLFLVICFHSYICLVFKSE